MWHRPWQSRSVHAKDGALHAILVIFKSVFCCAPESCAIYENVVSCVDVMRETYVMYAFIGFTQCSPCPSLWSGGRVCRYPLELGPSAVPVGANRDLLFTTSSSTAKPRKSPELEVCSRMLGQATPSSWKVRLCKFERKKGPSLNVSFEFLNVVVHRYLLRIAGT